MLVRQSTTVPNTSNVMARTPRIRSLSSWPPAAAAANAAVRANAAVTTAAEPLARNSLRLISWVVPDIEILPAATVSQRHTSVQSLQPRSLRRRTQTKGFLRRKESARQLGPGGERQVAHYPRPGSASP